jgi:uncharacterized protein (DUF1800 family)
VIALGLFVLPGTPASALSTDEIRHLMGRAGLGAGPADFRSFASMDRRQAVRHLLAGISTKAVTPPPPWASDDRVMFKRRRTPEERMAFRKMRRERARGLKSWWLTEMLVTPSPMTERMTLFWHNHFTSSFRKVKFGRLLYRQNLLLRRLAMGNFATLLHAIARDPAMVVYLDSRRNKLGRPNENFARELLELFTLGEGQYTEADIKEAARAFTGWSVNRRTGGFRVRDRVHDGGTKRFLGHSGAFGGGDIIDIILRQKRTARFIVEKLWRAFVSDRIDEQAVRSLARVFRRSKYDIAVVMEAMLTSGAFWARENRGRLVKSPSDLVIGTLRLLGARPARVWQGVKVVRALGQDLFNPPNVKGWPGGTAWITSNRLLRREQFLRAVLSGRGIVTGIVAGADAGQSMGHRPQMAMEMAAAEMAAARGMNPGDNARDSARNRARDRQVRAAVMVALADFARSHSGNVRAALLPLAPVQNQARGDSPADRLRHLMIDPVYQLK